MTILVTAEDLDDRPGMFEKQSVSEKPDARDQQKLHRRCTNDGEWCGSTSACCGGLSYCINRRCTFKP